MVHARRFLPVVSAAALLVGSFTPLSALAFSDLSRDWRSTCIDQLFQRKLVSGYPDNTFRPNGTLTRAEFAVLMLNAFPEVEPTRSPIAFRDVPTTHWAYRAIRDAYAREFFAGYPDGRFLPNQAIPRAQALAVLANAAQFASAPNPGAGLRAYFEDAAQVPTYAQAGVLAATRGRLVVSNPSSRQLRPNQNATRGEVATMLCQSEGLRQTISPQYVAGGDRPFAIAPELGGRGPFKDGLALAVSKGKYGYLNTQGSMAIAAQFDGGANFSEGLAAVKVGDRWGYINKSGQTVIQPRFLQEPGPFSEGLARVQENGQNGFIDSTGKVVFQVSYPDASSVEVSDFSDGLARVRIDFDQVGYVDKTGRMAIAPQPYYAWDFSEGLAAIAQNGQIGFIDKTGQIVIEPRFADVQSFSEGLAAVKVGDRWGYINKTGQIVIEPKFQAAQSFSEGLAAVAQSEGWSYINPSGAIAIAGPFSGVVRPASAFSGNFAIARTGNTAGIIDKTGRFVVAPEFADIVQLSEGLALANYAGSWTRVLSGVQQDGPAYSDELRGGQWGYIRP